MRQFASPTHLARAGAVAGLAAGAISAFVYALHRRFAGFRGALVRPHHGSLHGCRRALGAPAAALVRSTRSQTGQASHAEAGGRGEKVCALMNAAGARALEITIK